MRNLITDVLSLQASIRNNLVQLMRCMSNFKYCLFNYLSISIIIYV
jgi:hypothetical protein